MIKLRHANFKMYPSPKKLNYLQKNRETLSFWKNISLIPPAIKKNKISIYKKNKRKNITPRKSFNHPKIASTFMKKPQTPYLKILIFSKNPNSSGKVFNSFEVTRPIKPSPHEKISIPENLTPFRNLQSSHAHENRK